MTTELLEQRQDDIRLIRESLRTFVTRLDNPRRVRRLREHSPNFDRAVWTEMAESGWAGMLLSEEQGGLGLGFGELAAVAEELGREVNPEPFAAVAVLACGVLRRLPEGDLQRDLLGRFAAGEVIPAVAWQEEYGNLDPDDIDLTAQAGEGRVLLDGHKALVPYASGSDGFLVTARAGDELLIVWVQRDAPGLAIDLQPLTDGGDFGRLGFAGVEVAESAILARGDEALSALRAALDETRLAVAAELFGLADRALEMTVAYLRERKQFDVPIGSFQALQHKAADLLINLEMARSALLNAVDVFDSADAGPDARAAAAANAKARCADTALLITRGAIQLYGAIGYTEECDVSLYVRRALTLAPWLGGAAANMRRYLDLAPAMEDL